MRLPRASRADAAPGGHGRPGPEVLIQPDSERLARAAANTLIIQLVEAQAVHGSASVVLTGGGIGTAVLAHLPTLSLAPGGRRVDWSAVEVWWSDERFVPADDVRRNERGARQALLDPLGIPDEHVHPMPPSDAGFAEPEDAAAWYAEQLRARAPAGRTLPRFDVLLLGMGPEGHVASVFPQTAAVREDRAVFAVRDCPKPPPTRLSMGLSAINSAVEVWLLVAGEAKAPAVAAALSGADPWLVPAAGVHGTQATRWWLDAAAAGGLSRAGVSF